ncbi:MAG: hypothetical protein KTR18_11085 [Acidiferrobacterales bacterium]|nr:hypothetical protein [Acidiferrobacterales bacterium]
MDSRIAEKSTISRSSRLKNALDSRVVIMLFLGFSAGLPILLIFGTLSVWLREAGVQRSMVTYFSWAALGYSFKFVWAPLVDQLKIPVLTHYLGRRRAWLLLSQCAVTYAIWMMSSVDPVGSEGALVRLAIAAVLLGFASATQDIVIDAFRIESASAQLQALLSSSYIAGYRIAMIIAGAGGLFLAEWLGSVQADYSFTAWSSTYRVMAGLMLIGIVTTLVIGEPQRSGQMQVATPLENMRLLILFGFCVSVFIGCYVFTRDWSNSAVTHLAGLLDNKPLASFLVETTRLSFAVLAAWFVAKALILIRVVSGEIVDKSYISPVRDFFTRYGTSVALILLGLIGLYRISDIVLGVISTVFYYELGFSKSEIASASKAFGVVMTIVGGFLGGILALKFGVLRILLVGAVLSALTNLLFLWLAQIGYSMPALYVVIGADNLSAGLASAAFVAFLSALTNIRFTAVQFAIFTSLMTLLPKILGGYSGGIVDSIGYPSFFVMTALIGLPVIFLITIASKKIELETPVVEEVSK